MIQPGQTPDPLRPDRAEEVVRMLDEMAAEERSVLEEAARLDSAPGLENTEAILEQQWRPRPSVWPGWSKRPWWWGGLAAAVLVVTWLLVHVTTEPALGPGPGSLFLDLEKITIHPVESYRRIEWSSNVSDGATFVVRVRDPAAEFTEGPLFSSAHLHDTQLILTTEETSQWPERVLIQIEAYDRSRNLVGDVHAFAERSSPR